MKNDSNNNYCYLYYYPFEISDADRTRMGECTENEGGEVNKSQVMISFAEPKETMEDLFRVLERGALNSRKQLGLPLLKDCLPQGWNFKCLQAQNWSVFMTHRCPPP